MGWIWKADMTAAAGVERHAYYAYAPLHSQISLGIAGNNAECRMSNAKTMRQLNYTALFSRSSDMVIDWVDLEKLLIIPWSPITHKAHTMQSNLKECEISDRICIQLQWHCWCWCCCYVSRWWDDTLTLE